MDLASGRRQTGVASVTAVTSSSGGARGSVAPFARRRAGALALAIAATLLAAPIARAQSPLTAWNSGLPDEPALTVRTLAPGFWVIRQSKHSNFEAPFMYLVAGQSRALLLDTGAEPASGTTLPVRELVDSLLGAHARRAGGAIVPLVVAHSHGHRDHRAQDASFAARANTTVIAADVDSIRAAFGIARWPEDTGTLDLGARALVVLPTPGHEPRHVMFYDATTRTLLSGDMLYPGLLTVRDQPAFAASAQRLAAFAHTHAIDAILGAHVEMSGVPAVMYPLESRVQPAEHALALGAGAIDTLAAATGDLGDFLADDVHGDFIVGRVSPPSTDPPAIHGMLLVGSDRLWFSHLPMFGVPHNYQLIFEGTLLDSALARYRADVAAHPGALYTIEPADRWVLPNTIRPGATFAAHLYRGHFERGGTRLASRVTVTVRELVTFRRFTPGHAPDARQWILFGDRTERFLAHRIEGPPDVDQVVQLCVGGVRSTPRAFAVETVDTLSFNDRTPAGRVCRVIYTERGDLAH